jgi:hypothetical protein
MFKFNYALSSNGDFTEVKDVIAKVKDNKMDSSNLLYAIDAACTNPEFLNNFQEAFQKEVGAKAKIKFRVLSEDEMKIQNDVNQAGIAPTVATTVLPSIERFIRSAAILQRVNILNVPGENSFYQMFDFDSEGNAAILSEVAAGTDVDEVLRKGDTLIPNQKVQASMKMSEYVIKSLDGATQGKYFARLARRVQNTLCAAILSNGSAAANGTARGDNLRGILNNYGINGTGDGTGTIGAIAYATKAATDTAITTLGGVASTDAYDLLVKAKSFLLPSNVTDVEEDDYVFVGNRISWAKAKTVLDANGRYKASSAINPLTGKIERRIDDTEFLVVPKDQCPNDRVYIVPLKLYTLITKGELMNLNDGGLVQLKEGFVQFVARIWCSGSMEYGHKFRPATAVTIGTTVPDNAEQNAFRVINLS